MSAADIQTENPIENIKALVSDLNRQVFSARRSAYIGWCLAGVSVVFNILALLAIFFAWAF